MCYDGGEIKWETLIALAGMAGKVYSVASAIWITSRVAGIEMPPLLLKKARKDPFFIFYMSRCARLAEGSILDYFIIHDKLLFFKTYPIRKYRRLKRVLFKSIFFLTNCGARDESAVS